MENEHVLNVDSKDTKRPVDATEEFPLQSQPYSQKLSNVVQYDNSSPCNLINLRL